MSHSTTETFKMKREILNYSGRISDPLRKPERKFFADMLFGILASGSCLLSEITQELHESTTSLFQSIIEASRPIKTKVLFLHYRIELGIQQLLSYARTGIKDWFKPTQPNRDQYLYPFSSVLCCFVLFPSVRFDCLPASLPHFRKLKVSFSVMCLCR